jgi:hypothetical protein
MKSLPVTAVLAFLITGVMTSGTIREDLRLHNGKVAYNASQDTNRLMNLLSIDSFFLPLIQPASGVQFYKNGIIFLSDTKNETRMLPNHISFGTNQSYFAVPRDFTTGEHILFSASDPFPYPSEAITFSSDLKTMYFTKLAGKPLKEKIFMARLSSGGDNQPGWEVEKEPLDFCDENFSYSHPTLSSDGKILIFASNQQGSLGGMDIFITRRTNGKWSVPVNPGKIINTAGNEFYPFLDKDNNLYYSSDRLTGYGGYDIFICRYNGYDWDKPKNLSGKVNTAYDDIAFIISREDGKKGFLTRRNPDNKGEMQLFRVTMNPPSEAANYNLFTTTDSINAISEKLLTISSVFVSIQKPKILAAAAKPKAEPKEERKAVTAPAVAQPAPSAPEKKVIAAPVAQQAPVVKGSSDQVIYRVQFLASMKHKEKFQVTVKGKSYETHEYFYQGAYRYCIGEFASVAQARDLQKAARESGHDEAFVAAFRNNVRTLDMSLFR